jgi:hypothetical protein
VQDVVVKGGILLKSLDLLEKKPTWRSAMPSESAPLVCVGKWGPFSLWIKESYPRDTMEVLQGARIVLTSDATSMPTTTKVDAEGRFTLRLMSSHMQQDMGLELKGQFFIVPTGPASSAHNSSPPLAS